jgi:hypothetical protein
MSTRAPRLFSGKYTLTPFDLSGEDCAETGLTSAPGWVRNANTLQGADPMALAVHSTLANP